MSFNIKPAFKMERRHLSNSELAAVQKEIATKELAVLEILAEVYDHFVSHLELQKEEDFWSELSMLSKKWNYSHCQSIQEKFLKTAHQTKNKRQLQFFRKFFTQPPYILILIGLVLFLVPASSLGTKIFLLGIIIPLLLGLVLVDVARSHQIRIQFKILKEQFSFQKTGLVTYSAEKFPYANSLFYLFSLGKIWMWRDVISDNFPNQVIVLAALSMSLYLTEKIHRLVLNPKTALL
jgi:hypothetical protein